MFRKHPSIKLINNSITSIFMLILLGYASNSLAVTSCSANTSDLVFGNISMGAMQNSTAAITINCTTTNLAILGNVKVSMCLNIGAANGNTISTRKMNTPLLNPLPFQIYRDTSRSQIWGDSISNDLNLDLSYAILLIGGGGSISTTLYAQVPAQFGLAAGNYQNTSIGSHTRLDYRYAEPALLLGNPNYPTSCTSGGNGGGSITFPFTAHATVPASCIIDVVNNLKFGSVPGLITSNNDQTTHFSFTCTKTTPSQISLDNGLHADGVNRRMRRGGTNDYVQYELYSDSAHNRPWGSILGTNTVNNTGTGNNQTLNIYGRVPAPQSVPSGYYSDTVTVTISY